MKRTLFAAVAISLATLPALAITRVHQITGNVTSVTVNRGVDVDFLPMNTEKNVTVSGPDNFVGLVQVTQHGSNLEITLNTPNNKHVKLPKNLKVTLKHPPVSVINSTSSGDIHVRGTYSIGGSNLAVNSSSSGDIDFDDISATANVSLNASSSGDIKVGHLRAANLSVVSNSSGDIEVDNGNVSNISLSASSSGDITLENCAVSNLKADCTSSGDIELKSITAKFLILSTSSSGDIKASGAATAIKATASSGGVIDLEKLSGELQQAKASSGGHIKAPRR